MPKLGATTAAQSEHSQTSVGPDPKIIKPVKMRDLLAANSPNPKPTAKAADDADDMWDNMPV